jgi:hypothetical protein
VCAENYMKHLTALYGQTEEFLGVKGGTNGDHCASKD